MDYKKTVPIAIAILVLVILFLWIQGFFSGSLQEKLEKEKCLNNTEKLMNDLKLSIEKTASYKQPSEIEFNPLNCLKDEQFIIIKSGDEQLCKTTCLNSSSNCILLKYSSSENIKIQDKCINISPETAFSNTTENQAICTAIEGYKPASINFRQAIENGEYYFTYSESENPIVCSYLKSG